MQAKGPLAKLETLAGAENKWIRLDIVSLSFCLVFFLKCSGMFKQFFHFQVVVSSKMVCGCCSSYVWGPVATHATSKLNLAPVKKANSNFVVLALVMWENNPQKNVLKPLLALFLRTNQQKMVFSTLAKLRRKNKTKTFSEQNKTQL